MITKRSIRRAIRKMDMTDLAVVLIIFIVIVCFIFVPIILSLSGPVLTEGTVINKEYKPASHSSSYINGTYLSSSKGERFALLVTDGNTSEWWYVTEDEYFTHEVGEYIRK